MTRLALAAALAAAAAFAGPAAATESVCVTDPAVSDVYTGCTYVNEDRGCVGGGGAVLGARYAIACSPR